METVHVIEGNFIECKTTLGKIKKSMSNYDLCFFDEEDNFNYLSHAITEISCFGNTKLFIIKALPSIEIKKKDGSQPIKSEQRAKVINEFKKLLPSIPNGNIVIFYRVGIKAESFFKEARKYGKVYISSQKINKPDAKRKIRGYFKKRNIDCDDNVSSLIVDLLNLNGNEIDVDKLYLTIKKIYHYVYGKNKIVKEDIYKVCSSSKEFIIWSLYNLLDDKNTCSSIELVFNYLNNVKHYLYEASMLMKGMLWRYGLLLMIKNGNNIKMAQKDIVSNILNINKLESCGKSYGMKLKSKIKDGNAIPEYSYKMVNSIIEKSYGRDILSCYSLNQLTLVYYVLMKGILKIRTGCTESEIKVIILMSILAICGNIVKKNTFDGVLKCKKMLF